MVGPTIDCHAGKAELLSALRKFLSSNFRPVRSVRQFLIQVLAPIVSSALTQSDREVSGIIVAETPGSVTLRSAGGVKETILRADLKELTSSGLSLMPEGFEKTMNTQELADLIAFLGASNGPF